MSDVVISSLIGLIGVIVTAASGLIAAHMQRLRRKQAENELNVQRSALDFSKFVKSWDGFCKELDELMNETDIDRFLLLRAWNGRLDPRWTTAVFQYRKGRQKPVQYVHFELDDDYVNRVNKAAKDGQIQFDTKDLDDCAIKQIYNAEGVTSSLWMFVESVQLDEEAFGLTYCSFSTHGGEIDEYARARCRIICGRLKQVAMQFIEAQK